MWAANLSAYNTASGFTTGTTVAGASSVVYFDRLLQVVVAGSLWCLVDVIQAQPRIRLYPASCGEERTRFETEGTLLRTIKIG